MSGDFTLGSNLLNLELERNERNDELEYTALIPFYLNGQRNNHKTLKYIIYALNYAYLHKYTTSKKKKADYEPARII